MFLTRKHKIADETIKTARIEMATSSPDDFLDERLRVLKKMFGFTCLVFRDLSGGGKISLLRLLLAILIVGVSGYHLGFSFYVTTKNGVANLVETLIIIIGITKGFTSEVFIVYWQFGGFQRIYSASMWAELGHSRKSKAVKARTICTYVVFGFATFIFLSAFIVTTVAYYTFGHSIFGKVLSEYLLASHLCESMLMLDA